MSAFSASALYEALVLASRTAEASTLHGLEAQLEAWETEAAYWEALLDIALGTAASGADAAPPTVVRQLAMIRFKNGITKYWRARIVKRVSVTIPREAKARLRARLLHVLFEPETLVAAQGAVAIARVARLDVPDEWPELVPAVQTAIGAACDALHAAASRGDLQGAARETRVLLHATDILRQCLKEFESVRVLAGKMRMTQLARSLLPALQPLYEQYFHDVMDTHDVAAWAQAPGLAERVRASHLFLKVLHRLAMADTGLLASAVDAARPNLAYSFFACTPAQVTLVAQRRAELLERGCSDTTLLVPLTKHMIAYAKLHLSLVVKLHGHVARWAVWPEVVEWYWTMLQAAAATGGAGVRRDDGEADTPYPYRWLVCALVLVRQTLTHWKRDRPPSMFAGAQGAQFELEACDVLLRTYLRLTPSDLEAWQADPEAFAIEEAQADPDLDLRPAAEQLLVALARWSYRSGVHAPSVAEHLWQQFEQAAAWDDSLDAVLARDAVYSAVARCRDQLDADLADHDDASGAPPQRLVQAIQHRLLPEAARRDAAPAWLILRRRIAWMLWEWSDYVSVEARPAAYELLVSLLPHAPGYTDAAVQLAATRTLAALTDALEFDADVFAAYLGDALGALVQLLAHDLEEMDSLRTVTHTLAVVIERVGARVEPYAAALAELVPPLWMRADPDARVKPNLLEFVEKLVDACTPRLGGQPQLEYLHSLVEQVVRSSFEPASAPLLAHDALLLWVHTLQSAPHMTTPLFQLWDLAADLVGQPDHAAAVCQIWEDGVLLAPNEALQHAGVPFYHALAAIVGEPESPIVMSPLHALDTHVRMLDEEGRQALAHVLHTTGLGVAVLQGLTREDAPSVTGYFVSTTARLAYALPPPSFHALVRTMPSADGQGPWRPLILSLVRGAETMPLFRRRKLVALGLAQLLRHATADDVDLLSCVPEMIAFWSEVLGDVVEDEHGNSQMYQREESPDRAMEAGDEFDMLQGVGMDELEPTRPAADRVSGLRQRDAVVTVTLRPWIGTALDTALATHPPSSPAGRVLHERLQQMDPLLLDMLQKDLHQPPA